MVTTKGPQPGMEVHQIKRKNLEPTEVDLKVIADSVARKATSRNTAKRRKRSREQ